MNEGSDSRCPDYLAKCDLPEHVQLWAVENRETLYHVYLAHLSFIRRPLDDFADVHHCSILLYSPSYP